MLEMSQVEPIVDPLWAFATMIAFVLVGWLSLRFLYRNSKPPWYIRSAKEEHFAARAEQYRRLFGENKMKHCNVCGAELTEYQRQSMIDGKEHHYYCALRAKEDEIELKQVAEAARKTATLDEE